jgi:DNA repair photolyase
VLRDLDLIERAAQQTDVSVSFSIGTLDERVWRISEPGSPHPRRRIEAMRTLAARGIRTGALIAPILPGLSDRRDQLKEVIEAITDTGGQILGVLPLHLRPGTREHYLSWLAAQDPALHTRYLAAYRGRSYLDPSYGRWLQTTVRDLKRATESSSARLG